MDELDVLQKEAVHIVTNMSQDMLQTLVSEASSDKIQGQSEDEPTIYVEDQVLVNSRRITELENRIKNLETKKTPQATTNTRIRPCQYCRERFTFMRMHIKSAHPEQFNPEHKPVRADKKESMQFEKPSASVAKVEDTFLDPRHSKSPQTSSTKAKKKGSSDSRPRPKKTHLE
ncbi:Hypothetical protein FKW44_025107 [Caligus rogercresseyi]|uniref:Uncharacterized protein n=1 Tax=Caligus rogercresseyi TaxID=217165 RepID=A0A7T8GKC0_CALRO|nr:Hypothetical protein FKW44_025107 [Caligus rogercresseyi]